MSAIERASFMEDSNLRVLIDAERLRVRVREMGQQITQDYAGRNLHLIGVLKGACVFLSDLMRSIDLPLSVDFIGISSYGASTKSSGEVRITKDLDVSLAEKSVGWCLQGQLVRYPQASHFLHEDLPEEINKQLTGFFTPG